MKRTAAVSKSGFAVIAAGTTKTDYRDFKPYWQTRLEGRQGSCLTAAPKNTLQ